MKGKVQTVLGDLDPCELGRVHPHEHFESDVRRVFLKKPFFNEDLKDKEISMQNLGWVRQFPYSCLTNMNMTGPEMEQIFTKELKHFKKAGGGTIVENTSYGIAESMERLITFQRMSKETGVHIVAGTAFYVDVSQKESNLLQTEEQLADILRKNLAEGATGTPSIKCGMLGEIGCSYPLTDFELRSLKASAAVEREIGCPVMIHPGRSTKAPAEIVRVFAEAGGNPKRMVMGHLDRTLHSSEDILEFASNGTFLEYDLFGIETSLYQMHEEVAMPSDSQRIERIQALLKDGYGDKLLVSHDIHTKHRLEEFGGHGFSHILRVIVPMMLKRGISQEEIDKILIDNPANWLTFTK